MRIAFLLTVLVHLSSAQYGLYGGGGYGGYGGYGGGMPFMPDPYMGSQIIGTEEDKRDCRGLPSMRARSICRYGNPMMGGMSGIGGLGGLGSGYGSGLGSGYGSGLGAGMYGGGCTDLSPQCSVWASTGQCATNPMMMRQTCAMSCGTCATGLTAGSASFYNPFGLGGMSTTGGGGGLDQYPLAQFIGRSIYETGRDQLRVHHENQLKMSRDPATAHSTFFKGAWSPRRI